MKKKYEPLFEPFTFPSGVTIDNRIAVAPMTHYSSNEDGTISDQELDYIIPRSKEMGMVITACANVTADGKAFPGQPAINQDSQISGLKKLAQAIQAQGSKAIVQIHHGGIECPPELVPNQEVVGAIYVVASMEDVFNQMKTINKILASGTGLALVLTALLGIFLARTITHPLSDMRRQAMELAKGNFSRKVRKYGHDEIGQLATTFNHLTRELEDAQAMTEGERRKLSSVIAYMTDGVIATNRNGAIILLNSPALELLNVSRETALEMPITSLLGIHENFTFEDLVEQQESMLLEIEREEQTTVLRVNFSVIEREHGKIDGLIAVIYDVTEQEKIDQERREFVANVSHELRTPLTTMRSYLEALAEGAWENKDIAPRFLMVTQNETERMIRLVNDLLQLSKFDSKDYQFNREWIHFIRFISLIIDRFEMTKEQHVEFIRQLPDRSLYVEIDQDKITQVLDNIISNALKYSPEGGHVTFSVNVNEEEELLYISVKDEGIGIPKKDMEKIFERFYRVDKARTRKLGGTGLGLAIAKEMVQAHGGDIWADSIEGKGTTVTFTLPYKEEQEDDWDEA
ncbi:cell wall metabolism sensor histidine kinase WalK [Bacillus atrophaeus]|uniref:cell wall metabolism sensor histidine kinase WalK n=1 Tax=Bacillus atrophaeus TaxID=1452 RepID=UPI002282CD21|nr:cell wall metabolism sensor histidine kinase WalK [Bacillus atrophaeus]